MLSKRLEELSRDPADPEGIVELVVTSLGTQGSFYICWKTRTGQHRQDSHGLPQLLQEWLFPNDGSTRDFTSLQVILGPGDGDFVASDRNGRIDRKASEPPPRLERARTFRSYDGSTGSRPLSMIVNSAESLGGMRQRRSATVGSMGYSAKDRRESLIHEEILPDTREQREELPRLASFVPIVARVNRFRRRPTSMYHSGPLPLLSAEALQKEPQKLAEQAVSSRQSLESLSRSNSQRSVKVALTTEKTTRRPVSLYVDACVQTETPPTPLQPIQTTFHGYHHGHNRDPSSASSTSSIFTSYSLETSTRRSSIAEEQTAKLYHQQPSYNLSNPILMGRMQDYFRASGYRLGDALTLG